MSFFSCQNLSKKFNDEIVLNNINISFPSSGIISLTGPSGCGKSTLLNCLLGLETCEGEIFFQNQKIKDFDRFRNVHCGVIFQNFHLFEFLTVQENIILFGKSKIFNEVIDLLDLRGKLNQKVGLLSGGEKQRVAIARTLMKEPSIIFCDEITGSLDQKNANIIMRYLKKISEKILIINISHNIELVKKYSDQILTLVDHKLDFVTDSPYKKITDRKKQIGYQSIIKTSMGLMKKASFKIILSIISLVITLTTFGLIINVNSSLKDYFIKYKASSLDYQFLELTIEEELKIENTSFSLIKHNRPSKSQIDNLKYLFEDVNIGHNYANILNSYSSLKNDNKDITMSLLPCLDSSIKSYHQVIVNQKGYELLKGNQISYWFNRSLEHLDSSNKLITDLVDFKIEFEVIKVNEESSLFQNPIIYYHYSLMEEFLNTIKLDNLSLSEKQDISLAKRIIYYCSNNDYFNTGSVFLIVDDINEVENLYKKINNFNSPYINYLCLSRSLDNFQMTNELLDSIVNAIEIFLSISLIISLAILFLCINSLIIDEEKELGILKSLGVLKKQVNRITTTQVKIILFTSYLFSLLIKLVVYRVLNYCLPSIDFLLLNNIASENLFIILILIVTGMLFSKVTIFLVNRIKLSDVLRED